jgi:hypothetical protein
MCCLQSLRKSKPAERRDRSKSNTAEDTHRFRIIWRSMSGTHITIDNCLLSICFQQHACHDNVKSFAGMLFFRLPIWCFGNNLWFVKCSVYWFNAILSHIFYKITAVKSIGYMKRFQNPLSRLAVPVLLSSILKDMFSGVTGGCLGVQKRGSSDKNGHKIFANKLGKLTRASFIEGEKICNGWPPKAGIGEIVEFGPLFLVDIHRENLSFWKNSAPLKKLRGSLRRFCNATGYADVIKEQLIISVTGSKITSSESLINWIFICTWSFVWWTI